jgi:hypothetical protein
MKEEILKCDKDLLKAAKQAGSIGGEIQKHRYNCSVQTKRNRKYTKRYTATMITDIKMDIQIQRYRFKDRYR